MSHEEVIMKRLLLLLSLNFVISSFAMDAPMPLQRKRAQGDQKDHNERTDLKVARLQEKSNGNLTDYTTSPITKDTVPQNRKRTIIACFNDMNIDKTADTNSITAFLNGQPVGHINFSVMSLPHKNSTFVTKIGCINSFFIEEPYRKKGYGFDLFKKAYEYLRQHGALEIKWVITLQDNPYLEEKQQEKRTIFKNITAKLGGKDIIESAPIRYAGRIETLFTLPMRYENEARRPQELSSIPFYYLDPLPEFAHLLKKPKPKPFTFHARMPHNTHHECADWLQEHYETTEPMWDPIEEKETITAYYKNRAVGHITFSDSICEKTTQDSAIYGFIHSFQVDQDLRGYHIGFDLFKKMYDVLKKRDVSLITWYVTAPPKSSFKNELKQLETIFHSMSVRLPEKPKFNKGAILFHDGLVGRRLQIKLKEESKPAALPLKPQKTPTVSVPIYQPISNLLPPIKELPASAPDFLKEYIQQKKLSGEKLHGREEFEFTIPVEDDLYDNSYTINLRTLDKSIVAEVTYGKEIGTAATGAIHYFYMKPRYLDQDFGYPLFKKAVTELKKLGYNKITWQALIQKPEMTRKGLHDSIKYFAERIKAEEGYSPLIDNDHKSEFITLYLQEVKK